MLGNIPVNPKKRKVLPPPTDTVGSRFSAVLEALDLPLLLSLEHFLTSFDYRAAKILVSTPILPKSIVYTILPKSFGYSVDGTIGKILFEKKALPEPQRESLAKRLHAKYRGACVIVSLVDGDIMIPRFLVDKEHIYTANHGTKFKVAREFETIVKLVTNIIGPLKVTVAQTLLIFSKLVQCARGTAVEATNGAILLGQVENAEEKGIISILTSPPENVTQFVSLARILATIKAGGIPLPKFVAATISAVEDNTLFCSILSAHPQIAMPMPKTKKAYVNVNSEKLDAVVLSSLGDDEEVFCTSKIITASRIRSLRPHMLCYNMIPHRIRTLSKGQTCAGKPLVDGRMVNAGLLKSIAIKLTPVPPAAEMQVISEEAKKEATDVWTGADGF